METICLRLFIRDDYRSGQSLRAEVIANLDAEIPDDEDRIDAEIELEVHPTGCSVYLFEYTNVCEVRTKLIGHLAKARGDEAVELYERTYYEFNRGPPFRASGMTEAYHPTGERCFLRFVPPEDKKVGEDSDDGDGSEDFDIAYRFIIAISMPRKEIRTVPLAGDSVWGDS